MYKAITTQFFNSMSYKHNDLMAMRQRYWQDQTEAVQAEKCFFQHFLTEQHIYNIASLADAEYFFFSLPSQIIIKGYAIGFQHPLVFDLLLDYVQKNREALSQRLPIKIQYRL